MSSNKRYVKFGFLFLDIICLFFSFFFAYYLRHHSFDVFDSPIYANTFIILCVINFVVSYFYNLFNNIFIRGYLDELKKTFIFVTLSFLFAVTYLFIVKESNNYSRLTLVLTYILYFICSYITRIILKKYLRKRAKLATQNSNRSLLVLCKESELDNVITKIYYNNYDYYCINGICVTDKNMKGSKYKNYNIVANIDDVLNYVSTNWVDDIFIATDYKEIPKNILNGFKITGIPIHILLENIEVFNDQKQVIDSLGDFNVITAYKIEHSIISIVLKRALDIVGGLCGCVLTAIITIIIGPIIYIKSPGNIFYVSKRIGKNGKIFKFYKFRSMIIGADEIKDELRNENKIKDGMMFKIDNDPRIIKGIGTFIRKTSLDEFPQFFNVLLGDMSIVGTRPPTIDEWSRYSPYYRSRLSIKPGITGLWQVSGRSNIVDFDEVVKLDNEYINNWSITLDIKIIWKTIISLFNSKNNGAV